MKIYILRGLPGAGKSSWINKEWKFRENTILVCSADKFHMKNGEYRYDPKNQAFAHKQCFKEFVEAVIGRREGIESLIVDNTNTTAVEIAPYVRMAESFGIEYEIIYFMTDPAMSIRRNVHKVPPTTILNMHKNLVTEILPPYWNQTVFF